MRLQPGSCPHYAQLIGTAIVVVITGSRVVDATRTHSDPRRDPRQLRVAPSDQRSLVLQRLASQYVQHAKSNGTGMNAAGAGYRFCSSANQSRTTMLTTSLSS